MYCMITCVMYGMIMCVMFLIGFRSAVFYSNDVNSWVLPFFGADRSIVSRTQYYNYEVKQERPVCTYSEVGVVGVLWCKVKLVSLYASTYHAVRFHA